jgi:endonuclease III
LKSLSERKRLMIQVLKRLESDNPDPRCELFYRTPYQLLVAVVLSAQATDKIVNRCMQPLFEAGFSPASALALGEAGILSKIRAIGLAPTKARNIYALTEILLAKHGGEVPDKREDLEALPGVGRKTANVVLGEIFRQPTLAVDTHVFRVTTRLGFHQEKSPEKCEAVLLSLVPTSKLPRAHHWFILHGRYVCKAQRPDCGNCTLRAVCPSAP